MANTGRKKYLYEIQYIEDLEEIMTFAKNKAERTGLRIHQEYKHDIGLSISIARPKDKINVFDHVLRDFVAEINENN